MLPSTRPPRRFSALLAYCTTGKPWKAATMRTHTTTDGSRGRLLPKGFIAAAVVLATFALPAAANASSSLPAGCVPQTSYPLFSHSKGWLATSYTSIFVSAPGTVSLTLSKTAQTTATVSANFTFSVSDLISSASAQLGISLARSNSRTQQWNYTKSFGGTVAQRAVVSHHGEHFTFQKQILNSNCRVTIYKGGSSYMPYRSTSSTQYCYHLAAYPASSGEAPPSRSFDQK